MPGNYTQTEKAILDTLCYRAVFDYPLSFCQLGTYLISKNKIDREDLIYSLEGLIRRGDIKTRAGKYFLKGVRPVSWDYRAKQSKQMIKKTGEICNILARIPWVRMVCVTGAAAAYGATQKGDVDIYIVSRANRVWITRFFVWVFLKSLGVYRTDEHPEGKICPNIFVDELNLSWKDQGRNVYIAHEIVMSHPVVDKEGTYLRYLKENSWVLDFFGNFKVNFPKTEEIKCPESKLMDFVEWAARRGQFLYQRKRQTTEITQKGLIHFNRDDATGDILDKYSALKKDHGLI